MTNGNPAECNEYLKTLKALDADKQEGLQAENQRLRAARSELVEVLTEIRDNPNCEPAEMATVALIRDALQGDSDGS